MHRTVILAIAFMFHIVAWPKFGVAAVSPTCASRLSSPLFVPIMGEPAHIVFDDGCDYIYVANRLEDRVEVFSIRTGNLEKPILVGKRPVSLDTSADGRLLYVANSESQSISVVDLEQRREIRKIDVPVSLPTSLPDRPLSIARAANGLIFLATAYNTQGAFWQFDASEKLVQRNPMGRTSRVTVLKPNADRSLIAIVFDERYPAPHVDPFQWIGRYRSSDDTFMPMKKIGPPAYATDIAIDALGVTGLASQSLFVLDKDFEVQGKLDLCCMRRGLAVSPSGSLGYVTTGGVDVIDMKTQHRVGTLGLGDTVTQDSHSSPYVGKLSMSRDGSTIAVITDHGIGLSHTSTPSATPAEPPKVIGNCTTQISSPYNLPVNGQISAVAFDDKCRFLYASNSQLNQIEVFQLETLKYIASIPVGVQPGALALSPDNQILYVANFGASDISVVNLERQVETHRVPILRGGIRPIDIGVAQNGFVFVATEEALVKIDPRSSPPYATSHFYFGVKRIAVSGDRSTLAFVTRLGAQIFQYKSATDSIPVGIQIHPQIPLRHAALDDTGSKMVFTQEGHTSPVHVANGAFTYQGELAGENSGGELMLDPTGKVFYRHVGGGVTVYDTATGKNSEYLKFLASGSPDSRAIISRDGRLIAAPSATGISLFRPKNRTQRNPLHFVAFANTIVRQQSTLRFVNDGPFDGTIEVELSDLETGRRVTRWTSPNIPVLAAMEFPLATIEFEAGVEPHDRPAHYLVRVVPKIRGSASLVVTYHDASATTPMSTCEHTYAGDERMAYFVPPSQTSPNVESTVVISNSSDSARDYFVNFRESDALRYLGRTPNIRIAAGSGRIFPLQELERLAGVTTQANVKSYRLSLAGEGEMQHLMWSKETDTITSMAVACELPRQVEPS